MQAKTIVGTIAPVNENKVDAKNPEPALVWYNFVMVNCAPKRITDINKNKYSISISFNVSISKFQINYIIF